MNGFFVTNELDKYDEAIKQGMAGVLCSDEKLAREIAEAMTAAKSRQNNSEIAERVDNLRTIVRNLDETIIDLEGALNDIDEELDHLEVALADENGELDDGEGEYGLCGGCDWLDAILDEDDDEDEDEDDVCPRCGGQYYCECGEDDEDEYNEKYNKDYTKWWE